MVEEVGARPFNDGTYELCGPKIGGNAEGLGEHMFFKHGTESLDLFSKVCPRDFDGLKKLMGKFPLEGIVFAHPDGRMCKIRVADFGFERCAWTKWYQLP